MMQIFRAHPDFAITGETADLVFGPWYSVELAEGITRWTMKDGERLSMEERATLVVRNTFLALFLDNKNRWMHKPINIPRFHPSSDRDPPFDIPAKWYWNVMKHVFPRGVFLTILRNPLDVVVSSMKWHGWTEAGCWMGMARVATLITDEASLVSHAVVYEDLAENPERVLRDFLPTLSVPYHPAVIEATKTVYVPSGGPHADGQTATARHAERDRLNPSLVTSEIEASVASLWSKFGAAFDVPERFRQAGVDFGMPMSAARLTT